MLSKKWELVRELISAEQGGHRMNDETRLRLAKLEASVHSKRGSMGGGVLFSPSALSVMSPGEVDSTSSILDVSDLSFDNTQGLCYSF